MKTSRFALPAILSVCLAAAPAVLAADVAPANPATTSPISAPSMGGDGDGPRLDPAEVAADVLVVRPVGLAATLVGAAIFVVALPFAAIARDVKGTGDILVGAPARFTFVRKIGDFESHH